MGRTLAVILLLTLASLSRVLAETVPDIDELQIKAISLIEKWAFPGSSIESMLSIMRTMRSKYQILY